MTPLTPITPIPSPNASPTPNPLEHLPHGPEFRFLDRVVHLDPGKAGSAEYHVTGREHFLAGHFPGNPLFPGVLLIEGAAQLAGAIAQSDPAIPPLPGLKLTALRAVKILDTARPGQTIAFNVRILARMNHLIQAEATASLEGKIILQAELTLTGA